MADIFCLPRAFVLKAAPGAEGAAAILQGARECGGRLTDLTLTPRHRDPSLSP